jgi:hypothetical protein
MLELRSGTQDEPADREDIRVCIMEYSRRGNMKDKQHKIYFSMENGEPKWEIPGLLKRILKSLKPGVRHEMTVKTYRKNATAQQRKYYWGVMLHIMETDGSGYTQDEWHQIFSEEFLSYEKGGKKFIKSTESLTTVEREEYHRKVRESASMNHNVYLPLPNEVHWTVAA